MHSEQMTDAPPIEHSGRLTAGDFTEAEEPWRVFAAWFADAKRAEPNNPDAMTLATVDADGMPNARMVLLKGFDECGFVFYTNLESVKGGEAYGDLVVRLLDYYDGCIEPDPEEEFHRAVKLLGVQYVCSFEESDEADE